MSACSDTTRELLTGSSSDEQLWGGEANYGEKLELNPDVPKAEVKEEITMSPAKKSEW